MAKKGKKVDRASGSAGADRAGRWTVRGVAAGLQKAAGDAARARDLTLGQWLTEVVEDALGGAARGRRRPRPRGGARRSSVGSTGSSGRCSTGRTRRRTGRPPRGAGRRPAAGSRHP